MKLAFSSRLALAPPEKQGYLLKKGSRHASYQRRWCWLRGNLLLYWERPGDSHPPGLIVLEGSSVSLRPSRLEHAFSLCSVSRVYKMAAEGPQDLEMWVRALLSASHGYTRALLGALRGQYLGITGAAAESGPPPSHPQEGVSEEAVWDGDFGVLHGWLGEEVLRLREEKLIDLG
ncbi:sesquipedalian-1-like [Ascaphus truei]|uniref:sesquipedalian-1-like n=1 Tax=Ascaphus truei TaxID=8439 RepID=UPI003F59F879